MPPTPPPAGPDSALPSVGARVGAYVTILVGGLAGALIGHSYATLACPGGACTTSRGLWMIAGSFAGSIGVAVVAVLTLRAFGEWNTIRDRDRGTTP